MRRRMTGVLVAVLLGGAATATVVIEARTHIDASTCYALGLNPGDLWWIALGCPNTGSPNGD